MPRYQFRWEAIHAHWPVYPGGEGANYALETLCCFPSGSRFRMLDTIDQCVLMVAIDHISQKHRSNEYSEHHLHVALNENDLRELKDLGQLAGFLSAADLRTQWVEHSTRLPIEVREEAIAHARDFDWESSVQSEALMVLCSKNGVSVTDAGWTAVEYAIDPPELNPYFAERISPLLAGGFYDSAVREAAILLEMDLCARTGTSLFGKSLIEHYVHQAATKAGVLGAFQRHLRSELRTFFSFIRNEFAHRIVTLQPQRCLALLRRVSSIYEMLNEADAGRCSFQDVMIGLSRRDSAR